MRSAVIHLLVVVAPIALIAVFVFGARRRGTSLLAAIVLLAVPAVQIWLARPEYFYSDKSGDDITVFIVYFCLGLACLVMGTLMLVLGLAPGVIAQEGYSEWERTFRSTRQGGMLGMPIMFVFLCALLHQIETHGRRHPRLTSGTQEQEVVRRRTVAVFYHLSWQTRFRAPALKVNVPVEELTSTIVEETSDGPRSLEFALRGPGVTTATLRLHRDDSTLDTSHWYVVHPETPNGLWLDRRDDGFRLVGLHCPGQAVKRHPALSSGASGVQATKCFKPESPLERYIPGMFGLEHILMYMPPMESQPTCVMGFRYRGRGVTISSMEPCVAPGSLAALASGVLLLDRLSPS